MKKPPLSQIRCKTQWTCVGDCQIELRTFKALSVQSVLVTTNVSKIHYLFSYTGETMTTLRQVVGTYQVLTQEWNQKPPNLEKVGELLAKLKVCRCLSPQCMLLLLHQLSQNIVLVLSERSWIIWRLSSKGWRKNRSVDKCSSLLSSTTQSLFEYKKSGCCPQRHPTTSEVAQTTSDKCHKWHFFQIALTGLSFLPTEGATASKQELLVARTFAWSFQTE